MEKNKNINEIKLVNSKKAAEFLAISEKTLMNLTSSGKVPYYKRGRSNRYRLDELWELIRKESRGVRNGN